MDVLNKKLKVLEIKINALRLEIIALNDELLRMADAGADKIEETYLQLKLKFLAKKCELAEVRSEKKIIEMSCHSGNQAA